MRSCKCLQVKKVTCWNSREAWKLQIVRMHSLQISNADWTHPCFGIQCFSDFRSKVRLPGHEWIWPPTWSENPCDTSMVCICLQSSMVADYWCLLMLLRHIDYWGYVWISVRTRKIAIPCWLLLPFCTLFLPLDIGLFSFRCSCSFHILVQSAIGHHGPMAPCTFITFHTLVAVRWDTEKIWLGRLTGRVSREGTTSPALALNTSLWNSQTTIGPLDWPLIRGLSAVDKVLFWQNSSTYSTFWDSHQVPGAPNSEPTLPQRKHSKTKT